MVGFRGRLVFAAISLAFPDDAYGLPYPDYHNPLPLKRRFINTDDKRVASKNTNDRRTYIYRPRRELGKANGRRRRMAMALEGAAAGVHGHRWLLKADLALCLRIGVLNCGSNVHVQLFSSSRASRPLSSHDLVRPSAVHFLHTHTHTHTHTHCSSPGAGGDRRGVCGGWFYVHGDMRNFLLTCDELEDRERVSGNPARSVHKEL